MSMEQQNNLKKECIMEQESYSWAMNEYLELNIYLPIETFLELVN